MLDWLAAGRHGAMDYMARHGVARARPAALVPGTLRIITARLNYRPPAARPSDEMLGDPTKAFVARYALGRDYHKVLRRKLERLAARIHEAIGDFGYRVFTDSAPVLEVALAAQIRHRLAGQAHAPADARSGLVVLPGRDLYRPSASRDAAAIVALRQLQRVHRRLSRPARSSRPYELDARRCISYLTIELRAASRSRCGRSSATGSTVATIASSAVRGTASRRTRTKRTSRCATASTRADLVSLFAWTEAEFDARLEGSAIRRIGYERWSRNLAVGLGNAPDASRHRRRARSARRRPVGARARACRVGARPARTLGSLHASAGKPQDYNRTPLPRRRRTADLTRCR